MKMLSDDQGVARGWPG